MKTVLACLVAAVLSVVSATAQSQSASDLYQEALRFQELKGDLRKAIELYQLIGTRYASDRAVAPKALLRLAECYEIVSPRDAILTYQRAAASFPDRSDVVTAVRARLAALAPASQASHPRHVRNDAMFPIAFSADGLRAVTFLGPSLALQDTLSGQITPLVPDDDRTRGRLGVFSPDGRHVAYSWVQRSTPRGAGPDAAAQTFLRVIGTGPGASPRTVAGPLPGNMGYVPVGWSSDSVAILAHSEEHADGRCTLAWIPAAGGPPTAKKTFEPWRPIGDGGSGVQGFGGITVSPDGRSIAFSAPPREGSADRYIYVMSADFQSERAVVTLAGVNKRPMWTPDSASLVFLNERSGQRGVWAVHVGQGAGAGEPQLIQGNFTGYLIDLPRTGDLFFFQSTGTGFSEFIAERTAGTSRIIRTFKGQGATWSRGNQLAFIRSNQPYSDVNNDLIIRSAATGEERLHRRAGISNVSPRWLSDDSGVVLYILPSGDDSPGGAFYRMDVSSGTFTRLFARDTSAHERSAVGVLSPDDRTLYLSVRKDATSSWTGIVGVDLATGVERPVVTFPGGGLPNRDQGPGLAISPDGSTLAISAWVEMQRGRVITVRTDGSGYRELDTPVQGGGFPDRLRWTPDGQSLVYVEAVPGASAPTRGWRTMRVSAAGGTPVPDGLNAPGFMSAVPVPPIAGPANIDLSPDGSHIIFSARQIETYDLFVIENIAARIAR